jgi:hypothetical protein
MLPHTLQQQPHAVQQQQQWMSWVCAAVPRQVRAVHTCAPSLGGGHSTSGRCTCLRCRYTVATTAEQHMPNITESEPIRPAPTLLIVAVWPDWLLLFRSATTRLGPTWVLRHIGTLLYVVDNLAVTGMAVVASVNVSLHHTTSA